MKKRGAERGAFSGPLVEVIAGLSKAADAVDPKYQDELARDGSLFIDRLIEEMKSVRNNPLKKPYQIWLDSSRDGLDGNSDGKYSKWGRFVKMYKATSVHCRELFSSGVAILDLPSLPPYQSVKCEPVTDEERLQSSIALQTNFARELGVLGEDEAWGDFIRRSDIRCVNMNDNEIVVEALRKDPACLVRMSHHDIGMIEFPAVLSKKHPGVAVHMRLYPLKGDQPISTEQAIAERRALILMSMFISTGLFSGDSSSRLQTPAGKDQFLEDLCRLVSIA
ncbi:hypothetical protein HYU45_04365 [Candidatus Daviesbacteria bacterium]|nr:hypothetical protein [Candidatus Daviesbacteria bacterium]MBI4038055.1 hypothetical protein [Candidatus Daviesbacteria bacterium]